MRLFILILIFPVLIFSQKNYKINSIGTNSTDQAKVIIPSDSGCLILAETIKNNKKCLLIYYKNKENSISWSKTISAQDPLVINDALMTNNGYILAAENYVNSRESLLLMHISENGEPNWVSTFNENGNEVEPYSIKSSPTAYYIGGFTKLATTIGNSFYNYSVENQFPYLLKTDKKGTKKWAKEFSIEDNKIVGEIRDIALTKDNNIIAIANFYNPESKSTTSYLIKLNEQGYVNWSKSIDEKKIELIKINLDANDNIFLAGKNTKSEKDIDILITKLNDKGEVIWSNTYGGDRFDLPVDLELNNNQIYLSATSNSFNYTKKSNALLLILDQNGDLNSHKYIESSDYSRISNVKSLDKEVYYTGSIIDLSQKIFMNTISGNINDLSSSDKIKIQLNKFEFRFTNSNISSKEVNGEINPNNIQYNYKIKVNNEKVFIKKL